MRAFLAANYEARTPFQLLNTYLGKLDNQNNLIKTPLGSLNFQGVSAGGSFWGPRP